MECLRCHLRIAVTLFATALASWAQHFAIADTLPLPEALIAVDTAEGMQLLKDSWSKSDFVKLAIHFETQQNLGYCGVATTAMAMNALGAKRPVSAQHGPYCIFNQDNVFSEAAKAVKSPEAVAKNGLTLAQLGQFLKCQDCAAEVTLASDSTADAFRRIVASVTEDQESFIIVNYLRKAIGQESGGHISPVAAYNKAADSVLILDVARFKYPPVWVPVNRLWPAMVAVDADSGRSRGFVVVRTTKK
jgi:hypothetical protein